MKKIKTLIVGGLCCLFFSCQTATNHKAIKVLPDQGIELEGKPFLLHKTSFEETLSCFKIKDTVTNFQSTAEIFDSEGNQLPCTETLQKRIDHENLSFYFTGQAKDSLKLNMIEIRLKGALPVELDGKQIDNTTLQIPGNYKNSIRFPTYGEDIHETFFHEYACESGITFWVDSVQNSIKLCRLIIQKKED